MDFASIPLFNVMRNQLIYMSARQGALAQNIANADTPGYKAVDIAEPDFKRMAMKASGGGRKLPMAITDSKDISGNAASGGSFQTEKRKTSFELNPDGNNVVIEEEMAKVASNQADYQKVLNLYGKTISLFKVALGVSGA